MFSFDNYLFVVAYQPKKGVVYAVEQAKDHPDVCVSGWVARSLHVWRFALNGKDDCPTERDWNTGVEAGGTSAIRDGRAPSQPDAEVLIQLGARCSGMHRGLHRL